MSDDENTINDKADENNSDIDNSDNISDDTNSEEDEKIVKKDVAPYFAEKYMKPWQIKNYNNTSVPLEIKNLLESEHFDDTQFLKYHQFLVKEYFIKSNRRGILVCHGVGQGKTPLAFSITNYVRRFMPERRILILLSKSLENNFRLTIHKGLKHEYTNDEIEDIIAKYYKFISLNASNMYKKMENADKTEEEMQYEKKLEEFNEEIIRESSLENCLLVIDEAHNLFNSITNGSKNAVQLYDLIMKTKNLRLIFLSGTPIINDPFELVACFNMLAGYISHSSKDKTRDKGKNSSFARGKNSKHNESNGDQLTLFSESTEEFEEYFVDKGNYTIKNREKFENRIFGLTSYYGNIYFNTAKGREHFPRELPDIVEKIHMSTEQFAEYMSARQAEIDEGKAKGKSRKKLGRFSSGGSGSSTYRVRTRQISNFRIPDYALGPPRGKKAREKFISRIRKEDLLNLEVNSPKMEKIYKNIKKHANSPGIVYSQFVSGEGLALFGKVLEANGYRNYNRIFNMDDIHSSSNMDENESKSPGAVRQYAILSGDVLPEDRQKIINIFNEYSNRDGSKIHVLLLSGAVAEGIDLKRGRHGHIMEPYWNYGRISQIKGRLVRFMSHDDLPEDQRNVQFYIYLSTYPAKYPKEKMIEYTTDVDIYRKATTNKKLIDEFMISLAQASFDCPLHYKKLDESVKARIKCKTCIPDDKALYYPVLEKDMALPNPCREPQVKKINVNEIMWKGVKYFYQIDDTNDVKIYEFNTSLGKHAPLPVHKPQYADIYGAILTGSIPDQTSSDSGSDSSSDNMADDEDNNNEDSKNEDAETKDLDELENLDKSYLYADDKDDKKMDIEEEQENVSDSESSDLEEDNSEDDE
jgi:hypothetical protein